MEILKSRPGKVFRHYKCPTNWQTTPLNWPSGWREKRWEEGAPGRSIQMTIYMSKGISHFTRSRGDPVTSPYPLSTPLREEVFEIEWSVEGESSAAHSWLIFETALPNLGVWVDIFSITISIVILSFNLGYYPGETSSGNSPIPQSRWLGLVGGIWGGGSSPCSMISGCR